MDPPATLIASDAASDRSKDAPITFKDTKDSGNTEKPNVKSVTILNNSERTLDSKIRRFTIGKRDPQTPNKTILLVGENGTGKSTLKDGLLTHLKGTKYEDKARQSKIIDEIPKSTDERKSECQTETIDVYDIFGLHNENFPYSLTIIDTPGFGDTCEDAKFPETFEGLLTLPDGVKHVDAVCLVLKEGTNRLSDRQRYVFNEILSHLGKNLEKNIVALITHSSGLTPSNDLAALEDADIKISRDDNNEPYYFLFNNFQINDNSQTAVNNRKIKEEKARKTAWEISKDGTDELLAFLMSVNAQDMKQTADVLREQIQIERYCSDLKEQIKFIEMKEKEIQQHKEAAEKFEKEADSLSMGVVVDEPYNDLKEIGGRWVKKAFRCETCEEKCRNPSCFDRKVIKGGKCISCGCDKSSHVRDKKRYVSKTRKVTKMTPDYEKRCDIGEKKKQKEDELAKIEKDLESKTTEKEKLVEEICRCFVELDHIALKCVSVHTYNNLNSVIMKLNETMVEKVDETRDKKLEEARDKLKEMNALKERLLKEIGQPAIDYSMPHLKKQKKAAAKPQQKDGAM